MKSELEIALEAAASPAELPIGLPLAHLTARRWLQSILNLGHLKPRHCKVLSGEFLYFSYGGVFYRRSMMQTENIDELPVALVFSPEIMTKVSTLFPFDSGAAASGLFGSDWSKKLDPFTRFRVTSGDALQDARRLVYHLFESNPRYVSGRAAIGGSPKDTPFPLLLEFLNADLSALEVDHRQRTIEAISELSVDLGHHLEWIGFPEFETSTVLKSIYKWTAPRLPAFYPYDYTKNYNPRELAARLDEKAQEDVIRRYSNFSS